MAYHTDNKELEDEQQQQQQGKKKMFSGRHGLGRTKGQQHSRTSKSKSVPSLNSSCKTTLLRGLSFSSRSRGGSVTTETKTFKSVCHPPHQQETIVDPIYVGPPEEEDDQLEPITLICDGTGNKCILTGVHENLETCTTTNISPGTSLRRRSSQQHHQEQDEIVDNKEKDTERKTTKSKRSRRLWKKISTSYKSLRAFDISTKSSTSHNDPILDDMASTKIGSSVMEHNTCDSNKQNYDENMMMNELDIVQHFNESFCLVVNSTMFYHSEQCSSSLWGRSGSSSTY